MSRKRDEVLARLPDATAREPLPRLHAEADRQTWSLVRHRLPHLPRVLLGGKLPWDGMAEFDADKLIALEPAQGLWLRPGAPVLVDTTGMLRADRADYLAWVRDPAKGSDSGPLSPKGGTEHSVQGGRTSVGPDHHASNLEGEER